MSYLFEEPVSVRVPFSAGDEDDVAVVPPALWNTLFDPTESKPQRAAVMVSLRFPPEQSFSCWCRMDEKVAAFTIPAHLLKNYSRPHNASVNITPLSEGMCHVSPMRPTPLLRAVLSVGCRDEPESPMLTVDEIQASLINKLPFLHQDSRGNLTINTPLPGSAVHTQHHDATVEYRVVLTDPVLQGTIEPEHTSLYVAYDTSPHLIPPQQAPSIESENEDLEIGEGFLGGPLQFPTTPSSIQWASMSRPVTSASNISPSTRSCAYALRALRSPISPQQDSSTIYVRTKDLTQIGILNGEWAVIQGIKSHSHRLARVAVDDTLEGPQNTGFTSPDLIYNILQGQTPLSDSDPPEIILQPTPFGTRKPPIPKARSVTVSRIASPLSIDRTYEFACLAGLRGYFKEIPRLLKKGDIIAVLVDTDDRSDVEDIDTRLENSITTGVPNEIVHFSITNIEYEVLRQSDISQESDVYLESTTGELGCWVDPASTRIVQAGVEHSRVPISAEYYGQKRTQSLKSHVAYSSLFNLSSAILSRNAAEYRLQLSVLLHGPRGIGKSTTALHVADDLGLHFLEVDCYGLVGDNPTQTEAYLRSRFEKASSCSPCIFLLKHIDALAQTSQPNDHQGPSIGSALVECMDSLAQAWKISGYPVVVFATTSSSENLPAPILAAFKHQLQFQVPDEGERAQLLGTLLTGTPIAPGVDVSDLACETAAFAAGDLSALRKSAVHQSMSRAIRTLGDQIGDLHKAVVQLSKPDIDIALSRARVSHAESIGTPQIPNVSWDDVGGMVDVKAEILDTIQLPLDHPELFASGLKKRSGILLYGPPGTGKTLLAKAVATSFALNFFSVKGPELLNMYIGESEANVRRVFQRAKDARPCVVFFDELDSIAPKRGYHGDSGGVMDRIVSQLLAELDGVSSGDGGSDVFVIGATNRPDLLDPALLRPGRFDRLLYLGVSDTKEAQLNILRALTRKFKLDPDLRLEDVVESCPFHFTGADFYALSSDALMRAMSRKTETIDAIIADLNSRPPTTQEHPYPLTPQYYLSELSKPADVEVVVSQEDFELSLRSLVPSVSPTEMEHYRRVQRRFSGNEAV